MKKKYWNFKNSHRKIGIVNPDCSNEQSGFTALKCVVDLMGIEPTTLRMRTVRSPKLSYKPLSNV